VYPPSCPYMWITYATDLPRLGISPDVDISQQVCSVVCFWSVYWKPSEDEIDRHPALAVRSVGWLVGHWVLHILSFS
jgi:hypothetical protein